MNNKKGISTIVATVLIVLITVAAVTILWAAVSPLISQDVASKTACFDAQNAIKIDTNQQYTCRTADVLNYRTDRGSNDIDLRGAEIYVDINGQTEGPFDVTNLPNKNERQIGSQTINQLTGSSVDMVDTDDVKISIAPLILIDGAETACEKSTPITVSVC